MVGSSSTTRTDVDSGTGRGSHARRIRRGGLLLTIERLDRQREVERAARARRPVDPDSTPVLLDDAASDVQTEPHASEAPVIDIPGAMESLEHQWLVLDRNADAAILDCQPHLGIIAPDPQRHLAAI